MLRLSNVKRDAGRVASYILIFIGIAIAVFPIYYTIATSFKWPKDVLVYPPIYIPFNFTLKNYEFVIWKYGAHALTNSIIVSGGSALLIIMLGAPAAYALSRFHFRGKEHLAFFILAQRMTPPVAAIIPYFIMFKTLHLIDTYWALILVYTAINLPFFVWMMREFFSEIPREIEESAMVDGCSIIETFVRIVLPLGSVGLVALSLLCFIFSWNEFLFAFLLTRTVARTIPVEIAGLYTEAALQWWDMTALATITLLPVIILTLSLQKFIIRGITLGAVKG
jgi:multiple sugar transport system permease protein